MKSNTKTAAVKSMKASKKDSYSAAADAIKNKLVEIKQDHHTYKATGPSLALFGHNPFRAIPPASAQIKSRPPQGLPACTSHQLVLF